MNQHFPNSDFAETVMSYYVVMVDYGRNGREAVVDPEMTRRGALDLVREVLGDGNKVAFVHHITMNDLPQDVTDELVNEARDAMATEAA
jgi:hypothetical protein